MRRRRTSPYSQIEILRSSRQELVILGLLTAGLGIVLSLFADLLGSDLAVWLPCTVGRYLLVGALALVLVALAITLIYARSESRWVPIEIQIPYHVPADGQPRIKEQKSYRVTTPARRAFMRRYRRNTPEQSRWMASWTKAKGQGVPFQSFIAQDHAELLQCLILYALHRHGEHSLGPSSAYGWWKVDLPAGQLAMTDLPPPLTDNPFLHADQRSDQWRLWWPSGVRIEIEPEQDAQNPFPRWRLAHRRYGYVEIRWHRYLSVSGPGSQAWRVLTRGLKLDRRSSVFIAGTRLEARACFHWTFWPGGDSFHDWATNLLAYLEEALDWGYYLNSQTDRLVAVLDERVGWVPAGTSVFAKLQEIEGRLETLETEAAAADQNLADEDGSAVENPVEDGEAPPGDEVLVV